MRRRARGNTALIGLAFVLAALLVACGDVWVIGDIEIEDVWGRPSPSVATAGAFFMTITNSGEDDLLTGGASTACGTVELHESFMNEEGAMAMRPVTDGTIAVPSGGTVELMPGGLHVMCIDKLQDFAEGAVLELTLQFENAGAFPLEVEIREP